MPWRTNYENESPKTVICQNTWTWQCMGYALVYTPIGSMNMDESDLGQALEALCCMKNPGWMWSMSKHHCQTSPSEMDCMCTCKNWCHHARIGSMPQREHVNAVSKGVLNSLNFLHHMSLIVDQRWGDWMEKALCYSSISSRNRGWPTFCTSTSGRSLSKWNMSKQTRDLMSSGWSYNSDRIKGQG